jgi:type VI secretion system secreted protein Hcp
MASPGYMWIKDDNGNDVKSDVKVKSREGSALVLGFEHEVRIPTDTDTGRLTGVRKHEPFVITKQFCPMTPVLNKACSSGKTLKEVKVSWYRINDQGQEEEYFRQTLSDVKVVSVKPAVQDVKSTESEKYGHLESVAFRYAKIQWQYLEGNIISQDTWTDKT